MSKLSENVVLFSQGAYGCIFMDDVTLSNRAGFRGMGITK